MKKPSTKIKLTQKAIEKLDLPDKGQAFVWDTETKGFGVRLTPGGKVFIVQGRVNGRDRRVKISPCETFSADEARKQARSYLQDMAKGIDPNEEKKRKKAQSITLEDVAVAYIKDRPLKQSSIRDINKHLNGIFKAWKDQSITTISRDMVLKLFRQRSEETKAQANQAFRVLRGLLNYAMATYRVANKPIIPDNPVQVISDAKIWHIIAPKNRRIPLEKVGKAWVMLEGLQEDPAQTMALRSMVDAVAFALLTGARWGECQKLTWENVNLEAGKWENKDTKNKNSVTLPLSTQATALLENKPRDEKNNFVFCSNKSKTGYIGPGRYVTDQLAKALNVELSPHDLRRTFRAIAAACEVELWRTKMLMNHKISNDVTIQSYTEKADLEYLRSSIQKIGDWIETEARIEKSPKVVKLERVIEK
jgi:integrase